MNYKQVRLAPGLHFVATPIGTARDITLRALDTLASADVLAAEDTRSLRHLMDIHGVPLSERRIIAYHDHSGALVQDRLVAEAVQGKSVAYASEAGMPLIADPGFELGRAMAAAGQLVTVAPGASAVPAALVLAGLPTDAFFFAGFLPNASAARKTRLMDLAQIPGTLVFYESPKRLRASLADMVESLGGERQAAICREITKKFEDVRRGTLQDLVAGMADAPDPKGEIVVVVDRAGSEKINELDLENDLRTALETHSVRDAAEIVSKIHGLPKRDVYQMALQMGRP